MNWPGSIEDGCDRNREAHIKSYFKTAHETDKMKLRSLDIHILLSLIQEDSLSLGQGSNFCGM